MNVKLDHTLLLNEAVHLKITGSKSESNRLLILKALYPSLEIKNLSQSDDTYYLQKALNTTQEVIDIGHAGTAMRFLTAYFATQKHQTVILTGSERMQQRPLGILVEALQSLGAEITYLKKRGFPPLKIEGKKILKNHVGIVANTSSQFITALLLIAPSLPSGLTLVLEGKITSEPYIKMTLALLKSIDITTTFKNNTITIAPKSQIKPTAITVESDWSSASYFYSIVALSSELEIKLSSFKKDSIQGDKELFKIYEELGVKTTFIASENTILLSKSTFQKKAQYTWDLTNTPDLAQTIAVTCFGLGVSCNLRGLHTLKIKETDRLEALKNELTKLGAEITITKDSLTLVSSKNIKNGVGINTYNDHRMAMAFAPIALKTSLVINDAAVVSKSYPRFWEHLKSLGFLITVK